jgi:hypothetical protein
LCAGFLLNILFNPEDGGDMFLWNAGCHWTTQCYILQYRTLHREGDSLVWNQILFHFWNN